MRVILKIKNQQIGMGHLRNLIFALVALFANPAPSIAKGLSPASSVSSCFPANHAGRLPLSAALTVSFAKIDDQRISYTIKNTSQRIIGIKPFKQSSIGEVFVVYGPPWDAFSPSRTSVAGNVKRSFFVEEFRYYSDDAPADEPNKSIKMKPGESLSLLINLTEIMDAQERKYRFFINEGYLPISWLPRKVKPIVFISMDGCPGPTPFFGEKVAMRMPSIGKEFYESVILPGHVGLIPVWSQMKAFLYGLLNLAGW